MGSKGLIESGVFLLQQLEICGKVSVVKKAVMSCMYVVTCRWRYPVNLRLLITAEPLASVIRMTLHSRPYASIYMRKTANPAAFWLGDRGCYPKPTGG